MFVGWQQALPRSQAVENALHTGVLGGAFVYGRKQRSPQHGEASRRCGVVPTRRAGAPPAGPPTHNYVTPGGLVTSSVVTAPPRPPPPPAGRAGAPCGDRPASGPAGPRPYVRGRKEEETAKGQQNGKTRRRERADERVEGTAESRRCPTEGWGRGAAGEASAGLKIEK